MRWEKRPTFRLSYEKNYDSRRAVFERVIQIGWRRFTFEFRR